MFRKVVSRSRSAAALAVGLAFVASVHGVEPNTPLIDAVKASDQSAVRRLLKQHADVNGAETDGTTALHWAVRADDRDTVSLLLKNGAKANAVNRYGVMPLQVARRTNLVQRSATMSVLALA